MCLRLSLSFYACLKRVIRRAPHGHRVCQIQEALGAGQKVFDLLDRKPKITGHVKAQPPAKPLVEQSDHASPSPHEAAAADASVVSLIADVVLLIFWSLGPRFVA